MEAVPRPPRHLAPLQALRLLAALAVLATLAAAIAGGLLRAGALGATTLHGAWLTQATAGHAFLMVGGFMGTVIGLERAVAIRHPASFAAPATSLASGLAMLAGADDAAAWLAAAASIAFVAVNVVVVRRQAAAHTVLLLVAALAWAIGNLAFALGAAPAAIVPWWFAFLVLTIAAERLEMTRLMRRRACASAALCPILAMLGAGAALSGGSAATSAAWGGTLYGAALALLAGWLLTFDIARRTVHSAGLSRYMAICLLLGYGWLLVGGIAWIGAAAFALPLRDAALHGVGLGFVFSMMLAHAPVILPAVARVRLTFGAAYYLPLALLHGSLLLRLGPGLVDATTLARGALLNAAAIAAFALTIAGSAIAWRLRDASSPAHDSHGNAARHR